MQKKCRKQFSSCILCIVLIVVMALFTTGCNGSTQKEDSAAGGTQANVQTDADAPDGNTEANADGTGTDAEANADAAGSDASADGGVLGEGSKVFSFTVVDKEGVQTQFEIHTDEETVGDALSALGLIEGDESEYGLYVKTVNGITADYDKDGMYWAFYINEEYAQTGVDATQVTEGDSYSFKMEKA
ncbi:MAG: DUF4430 domain-containing protein [Eubacterium sp.]|nr:DUF4430 domain-containing protein [Eubacterium sp.]